MSDMTISFFSISISSFFIRARFTTATLEDVPKLYFSNTFLVVNSLETPSIIALKKFN